MNFSKFLVCAVLCGGLVACGGIYEEGEVTQTMTIFTPNGASRPRSIPISLGSTVHGSISNTDNAVWYSFRVSEAGMLTVETTGSTDTRGTLYARSSTVEIEDVTSSGKNFKFSRAVTFGGYNLAVHGNTTGSYSLRVSFSRAVTPPAAGESANTAIPIRPGFMQSGIITADSIHRGIWFRIMNSGVLRATTTGRARPYMILRDTTNPLLELAKGMQIGSRPIERDDSFFLTVYGTYTGSYSLTLKCCIIRLP